MVFEEALDDTALPVEAPAAAKARANDASKGSPKGPWRGIPHNHIIVWDASVFPPFATASQNGHADSSDSDTWSYHYAEYCHAHPIDDSFAVSEEEPPPFLDRMVMLYDDPSDNIFDPQGLRYAYDGRTLHWAMFDPMELNISQNVMQILRAWFFRTAPQDASVFMALPYGCIYSIVEYLCGPCGVGYSEGQTMYDLRHFFWASPGLYIKFICRGGTVAPRHLLYGGSAVVPNEATMIADSMDLASASDVMDIELKAQAALDE